MTIRTYFAGPLFTHAEKTWNLMLADTIRKSASDIEVFLPQVETEAAVMQSDFAEVQRICLDGIDESDVVIAILDGADSDSGTCFECGYAYAKGVPVIAVRTDMRSGEDQGMNAMLTQSSRQLVGLAGSSGAPAEVSVLADRIIQAVKSVAGDND
jgi:nucleoside 2-deoxyribosyltransferase